VGTLQDGVQTLRSFFLFSLFINLAGIDYVPYIMFDQPSIFFHPRLLPILFG
jgi:hypothetical protein